MRLVAFVLCLVASLTVSAQGYPARPIKVVVPYAAGGLPDTMARLVGQKMGESLGQQLVVENRGGAGGIVGTAEVAKAAPDGYTLLVADVAQIAINRCSAGRCRCSTPRCRRSSRTSRPGRSRSSR